MHYHNLGRSGLKISPICLGTMMFGGPTDEPTSARIVAHRVGELGGEHESVPVVGNGAADHLLGIAAIIGVRGIDEIDAGLARFRNDAA